MLAIVAHGHPAEQFGLNGGIDRPLDTNRKRLEILGIVDLYGTVRADRCG